MSISVGTWLGVCFRVESTNYTNHQH